MKIKKSALQKVFGFENANCQQYLQSPELNDVMIAAELGAIKADINWIKRILWLIICGGGAGFYFS